MSRLIDADELEKRFNEECDGDCGMCKHEAFNKGVYSCKLITDAPTVPLPDFKEGYKQAIRDGKTNFSRLQGDCENCDFRKFTESFIDGVVEVMNKNGITSVEQLSEILKGVRRMTNKEAIEHLTDLKTLKIEFPNVLQEQSLELAIKALEFIDDNYPNTFIDYLNGVQI